MVYGGPKKTRQHMIMSSSLPERTVLNSSGKRPRSEYCPTTMVRMWRRSAASERTARLSYLRYLATWSSKLSASKRWATFLKQLLRSPLMKRAVSLLMIKCRPRIPKIFSGGDCANGGAEAVDASQMGKLAAKGIHFSLTGERVAFAGAILNNNSVQ